MVDKRTGAWLCSTIRLNKSEGGVVGQAEREADDRLSQVFAALADPTRRELVARLAVEDATLTELAAPHDMSIQAVAKHLKVLEEAGLVRRTRDAQRRPARLEAEVLDLMTGWIERRRREHEERYQRLDVLLDRMADDEAGQDEAGSGERRTGEAS
jgi:DNA-binding transcriptional ArsR family regulator